MRKLSGYPYKIKYLSMDGTVVFNDLLSLSSFGFSVMKYINKPLINAKYLT